MQEKEITGKQIAGTNFYEVGEKEKNPVNQLVAYVLTVEEWSYLTQGNTELMAHFWSWYIKTKKIFSRFNTSEMFLP